MIPHQGVAQAMQSLDAAAVVDCSTNEWRRVSLNCAGTGLIEETASLHKLQAAHVKC